MTSRETSEARIPSVPIEMPSEIAIVSNSNGVPPASRTPALTSSARRAEGEVAGAEVRPRVDDGDERPLEVLEAQAGRAQHRARRSPRRAFLDRVALHVPR